MKRIRGRTARRLVTSGRVGLVPQVRGRTSQVAQVRGRAAPVLRTHSPAGRVVQIRTQAGRQALVRCRNGRAGPVLAIRGMQVRGLLRSQTWGSSAPPLPKLRTAALQPIRGSDCSTRPTRASACTIPMIPALACSARLAPGSTWPWTTHSVRCSWTLRAWAVSARSGVPTTVARPGPGTRTVPLPGPPRGQTANPSEHAGTPQRVPSPQQRRVPRQRKWLRPRMCLPPRCLLPQCPRRSRRPRGPPQP